MSTLSNPLLPAIPALARRKCLAAVALHDARMDGAFVYAVRSTGIYCRPSCPSRRPRVKQILLFVQPEAAEQAGFRACRRCRPRQARGSPQADLIRRVCSQIEGSMDGIVSLRSLAENTGLSPAHLQRTFRQAMGITPRQYADALRVARLKSELRKGKDVTTAMHEVSYGSASRLYEKSDEHLGMTPATYRRGGRGMNILSPGGNTKRIRGAFEVGARDCAASGRLEPPVGFAHGCGGHSVSAARLGGIAFHPSRYDANVLRGRALHRPAQRDPRCSPRLRDKPCIYCGSMPSRGAHRRNTGRLPLGTWAQKIIVGARKKSGECVEVPDSWVAAVRV